jgi:hypothetical protein
LGKNKFGLEQMKFNPVKLRFFGLLHLAPMESSSLVLAKKEFKQQIAIYIKNAVLLSDSLKKQGFRFTLLTNKRADIESFLEELSVSIEIEEVEFSRGIPSGIRFYSAHFKLDLYRYFASLPDTYSILCDLDMVCLAGMSEAFMENIRRNIPMAYNITDQVCYDYGKNVVYEDLSRISAEGSSGHWYGGEFIGGDSVFFTQLADSVDEVFPQYIKVINEVNHVGDEAVTSTALESLRKRGISVSDAGKLCGVGRYWNCAKLLVFQQPFPYYKECFLLHLPADKDFLARVEFIDAEKFIRAYWQHRLFSVAGSIRIIKKVVRYCLAILCGAK